MMCVGDEGITMFDLCSFRFCFQEDSLITPDVESWFPVPRLVQCVSPNVEFLHCLSVLFEKIGKIYNPSVSFHQNSLFLDVAALSHKSFLQKQVQWQLGDEVCYRGSWLFVWLTWLTVPQLRRFFGHILKPQVEETKLSSGWVRVP